MSSVALFSRPSSGLVAIVSHPVLDHVGDGLRILLGDIARLLEFDGVMVDLDMCAAFFTFRLATGQASASKGASTFALAEAGLRFFWRWREHGFQGRLDDLQVEEGHDTCDQQ